MTLLEQLELIEERMERSFLMDHFDTFNQLLSERFVLLKKARNLPGNEAFFEQAQKRSDRWSEMLRKRIRDQRQRQIQIQAISGYGNGASSGRMLNRSL